MYVERQSLIAGDKLALNSEYKIIEEIGRGTSSIVYLAEDCSNSRLVLIKELYPKNLGIFRNTDNSLVIPASSNDNFEIYKSYLREAVKLQIEFHNSDELANSTSDAERIIEYNNTLYVVMGRVVGKSYDKVKPKNLDSALKICKSLTKAISFYHLKGYLHLDIKAENVFKIQETDELVKLFDFDSVHKKEDIINENCKPTYSKSCAAPEVKKIEHGKYDEIDERSDIYSIGAMLFKKVMNRDVDTEDSRPKKRWDFTNIELLKTESPQAKSALTEIFRNTLARNKEYRYKSTDELIEALDKAIEITSNKIFLCDHNITTTTSKDYYISRADKVREIREKLENYHIAYLYGIGGIGKSETAREYAETYRNDYEVIHFTHYSIGLKETLSSLNFINLDDKGFKFEERYNVRLNMLSKKEMYNSNTLLIIDNYNVAPDSDKYKNNVAVMKDLKKLDIHILFTTRTSHDDDNKKIDIEELSGDNLKQLFFAVNPKDSNSEERIKQVDELIETAFRHTLTVDLVAHQTVQIERYGKKTLADYITVLKNSGLNNEIKLSVYNNKDDNEKNDIVYEHIKALFNFSSLTDKERYVMVNACLLPVSGMETAEFCEFIGLANYGGGGSASDWGEDNTITNLVNSGWIKRVGENKERIALHPTISNVTVNELKPEITKDKCLNYVNNLSDILTNISNDAQYAYKYIEIEISCSNKLCQILNIDTAIFLTKAADCLKGVVEFVTIDKYCKKIIAFANIIEKENTLNSCELYKKLTDIYVYFQLKNYAISCYCKYINLMESLSQNTPKKLAELYYEAGDYFNSNFKDKEHSIIYFEKSFNIQKDIFSGYPIELAKAYENMGDLLDSKERVKYYEEAFQIKKSTKNEYILTEAYRTLGSAYEAAHDFKNAYSCYNNVLLYSGSNEYDYLHIARINLLGVQFKEAEKNINKAIQIIKEKNKQKLADIYKYIGKMFYYTTKSHNSSILYADYCLIREKAFLYYNEGLDLNLKNVISNNQRAKYYIEAANFYIQLSLYDKAYNLSMDALKIYQDIHKSNPLQLVHDYISIAYKCQNTRNYEKALSLLKEAYCISESVGDRITAIEICSDISEISASLSNDQTSLDWEYVKMDMLKALYKNNPEKLCDTYYHYALLCLIYGDYSSDSFIEARKYAKLALKTISAFLPNTHKKIAELSSFIDMCESKIKST